MSPVTEQPYVDPAHRVPDDEWAKVVARAKDIRQQTREDARGGAASGIAPVLDMTTRGRSSGKYFPVSGVPTQLLVLHSAECPLAGGYAQSLTEWASSVYPADPIASWQRFVDPLVRLRFIPDELGAWHASEANPLSIGWEQAGYARYTRDQWLTPDGKTQLESLAFDMAEVAVRDGIPARWLTTAEVRAVLDGGNRSIKGFCFHWQIDPETRTDPGGGYPQDLLMERIKFYMTGGAPAGAESTEEEDTMLYIVQQDGSDAIWIGDLVTRRPVKNPNELQNIQYIASKNPSRFFDGGKVQKWASLDFLGIDVVETTSERTVSREFPWFGLDGKAQPAGSRNTTSIKLDLGYADSRAMGTNGLVEGLKAQVGALATVVANQSNGEVSKEEVLATLKESFDEHVEQFVPAFVPKETAE